MHALVAADEARRGGGDPSKHSEVEARDREDVREPDGAEGVVDGAIADLDISEDERHEHRAHRPAAGLLVVGNTRQETRAQRVAHDAAETHRRPAQ